MLWKSKIVSGAIALTLSACAPLMTPGGATETATEGAICRAWGEGLPTRSRADTAQTQDEIAATYADFAQACPSFTYLIP